MSLVIDDLVGSTGLELKVDPGVPYVYAGFAGMPKHFHPLLSFPSDPDQMSNFCAFQLCSTLVLLLMWLANISNECFCVTVITKFLKSCQVARRIHQLLHILQPVA